MPSRTLWAGIAIRFCVVSPIQRSERARARTNEPTHPNESSFGRPSARFPKRGPPRPGNRTNERTNEPRREFNCGPADSAQCCRRGFQPSRLRRDPRRSRALMRFSPTAGVRERASGCSNRRGAAALLDTSSAGCGAGHRRGMPRRRKADSEEATPEAGGSSARTDQRTRP